MSTDVRFYMQKRGVILSEVGAITRDVDYLSGFVDKNRPSFSKIYGHIPKGIKLSNRLDVAVDFNFV